MTEVYFAISKLLMYTNMIKNHAIPNYFNLTKHIKMTKFPVYQPLQSFMKNI